MTFPNRINYRLRSREKSQQPTELTASDATVGAAPFASFCHVAREDVELDWCDDEDKPETAMLIEDHALLQLTHKLMAMIANPAKLLAALVVDCNEPCKASQEGLWVKVVAYQHAELRELCDSWCCIIEELDRYELGLTEAMLLKGALYYWRLWQYVCVLCVDAVARVEETVTSCPSSPPEPTPWSSLQRKRSALSPPLEDKSSDAAAQGMVLSGSGLAKRARITKKSNEFLVAWFLAHKENPYPSPEERADIAERTGLGEQQVRNWFANMRKRHWKPNRSNAKKPRCLLDYVLRQSAV
ncbi:unnamed protein product [Phytophthora lilii]|uniref:Unnamed protein product n=1 Tax=Phytophthora lilii TaxID=2077276 RepID=A0A9W6X7L8_9STRA|nr:unnamed protein product [Phytophthora lilii]